MRCQSVLVRHGPSIPNGGVGYLSAAHIAMTLDPDRTRCLIPPSNPVTTQQAIAVTRQSYTHPSVTLSPQRFSHATSGESYLRQRAAITGKERERAGFGLLSLSLSR